MGRACFTDSRRNGLSYAALSRPATAKACTNWCKIVPRGTPALAKRPKSYSLDIDEKSTKKAQLRETCPRTR